MSVLTLNVDEARRTLSNSDKSVFVINDKNVDIVRFVLLTGFTDIALDEHSALRVMYQRPGETQVRAQTLTYYDTDGIRNYYDWELLAADLAEKGTITCALCILRTDSEVEEWHTTPYQIRVLGSIHTDDSDEADESITPTVAQRVAVLESMIQRVASGAPIVVASASEMTDTEQIYVLSTNGRWYYHNGSAWVAGGEYGAVATDTTLTQANVPADAKAVGDAINEVKVDLGEYVNDLFEYGNIAISNSGWIYNGLTSRIRTKANTSLHLKAGVTVGLRNYTENVYYVGWKKMDGTYDFHDGWLREDFVTPVEGDYVFLIRYYTERYISNVSDLASLFFGYSISDYINENLVDQIDQYRNISFEKFDGFISATGSITAQTTDKETYTTKLPCSIGDIFNIYIRYSSPHALWLAYALYDWNGNFISRTVVTSYNYGLGANYDVAINNQNAKYISFTYRTFDDSIATIKANNILSIAINSNLVLSDVVKVHASDINTNIKGINHRGYNTIAPENTIPAYQLSKKNGFDMVETDVSFTSDNVAVLLHDDTINRTARNSDGTKISETISINSITYAEALTYDFGIWKGSAYAGTKIPTFEQFISLCRKIGLHPYIELKSAGVTQSNIQSLVDIVKSYDMLDKVTWISFNTAFLGYVKQYDPTARLGVVCGAVTESVITSAVDLKTHDNDVFIDARSGTADDVSLAKEASIKLEVWNINTVNGLNALNGYISGATTDKLVFSYELYKANI